MMIFCFLSGRNGGRNSATISFLNRALNAQLISLYRAPYLFCISILGCISLFWPENLCREPFEQARVALVPGAPRWFGPVASGHLRICFATSHRTFQEAFDQLEPMAAQIANERQLLKVIH
jgi:aspartate/methionine/tyrosine aminotransferase